MAAVQRLRGAGEGAGVAAAAPGQLVDPRRGGGWHRRCRPGCGCRLRLSAVSDRGKQVSDRVKQVSDRVKGEGGGTRQAFRALRVFQPRFAARLLRRRARSSSSRARDAACCSRRSLFRALRRSARHGRRPDRPSTRQPGRNVGEQWTVVGRELRQQHRPVTEMELLVAQPGRQSPCPGELVLCRNVLDADLHEVVADRRGAAVGVAVLWTRHGSRPGRNSRGPARTPST